MLKRLWKWYVRLWACPTCGKRYGSNYENCEDCEEVLVFNQQW